MDAESPRGAAGPARGAGTKARRSGLPRLLLGVLCVLVAYYLVQWGRDNRGLVGEVLAAPGEPTGRTSVDVGHVVRPHVRIGMEKEAAIRALKRGGFSVEVYKPAEYEWLHLNCPGCDEGVWGRYNQSILRGAEAIKVGIGLRGGRVAHMEAHRTLRELAP